MQRYIPVKGGDKVLIDLGKYGIEVELSADKKSYLIRYVGIQYAQGRAFPKLIPADTVVSKPGKSQLFTQAHEVKIWRHKAP